MNSFKAEKVVAADGLLEIWAGEHGLETGDRVFVDSPLGLLPGGIERNRSYYVSASGERLNLSQDDGQSWLRFSGPGSEVYLTIAGGVSTVVFGHSNRPGHSGFGLLEGGEAWSEQQKRDGQRIAEVTDAAKLESNSAQYRLLFSLWDSFVLVSYKAVDSYGRAGAYVANMSICRDSIDGSGSLNVNDLIGGRSSARSRARGIDVLARGVASGADSKLVGKWIYEVLGAGAGSSDNRALFGFGMEGWSFADHVEALAAILPWPLCRRIEVVSSDLPSTMVGDYRRFTIAQNPQVRPRREGLQQIADELVAALQGDRLLLEECLGIVALCVRRDLSAAQQFEMLFYAVRLTCGRAQGEEQLREGIGALLASDSIPEDFVKAISKLAVERLIEVGGGRLLDSLVEYCDAFMEVAHRQDLGAFVVDHLVEVLLTQETSVEPRLKHLQMLARLSSASSAVSGGLDALRALLGSLFEVRADVRDGTFQQWVAAMSAAGVYEQDSALAYELLLKFWEEYDQASSWFALLSRWRLRRNRKKYGRLLGRVDWCELDVLAAARVGERVLRVAWAGARGRTNVGSVLREAANPKRLPLSGRRAVCQRVIVTCLAPGAFDYKQLEILQKLDIHSQFFQLCLKLLQENFERRRDVVSAAAVESGFLDSPELKSVFDALGLRESSRWGPADRGRRWVRLVCVVIAALLGMSAVIVYGFFPEYWSALEVAWRDQVLPWLTNVRDQLFRLLAISGN